MRRRTRVLIITALSGLAVALALSAYRHWPSSEPAPTQLRAAQVPPARLTVDPGIQRSLAVLEQLPEHVVRAVQDLRLVAAVEMAYHTAYGRYASPEELKASGFLAAGWPFSDPSHYRISCDLQSSESSSFVCYAEPVDHENPYLRIDEAQSVRVRFRERPGPDAPLLEEVFKP